jgi:hypothetical protein
MGGVSLLFNDLNKLPFVCKLKTLNRLQNPHLFSMFWGAPMQWNALVLQLF